MTGSIYTDTYRHLIGRLVDSRKVAGLTQQTLADRLGKPQSYIAKVEGLERRLDVVEFLTIAKEIGVDPMPIIQEAAVQLEATGHGR